jgi:hypothetical protein
MLKHDLKRKYKTAYCGTETLQEYTSVIILTLGEKLVHRRGYSLPCFPNTSDLHLSAPIIGVSAPLCCIALL